MMLLAHLALLAGEQEVCFANSLLARAGRVGLLWARQCSSVQMLRVPTAALRLALVWPQRCRAVVYAGPHQTYRHSFSVAERFLCWGPTTVTDTACLLHADKSIITHQVHHCTPKQEDGRQDSEGGDAQHPVMTRPCQADWPGGRSQRGRGVKGEARLRVPHAPAPPRAVCLQTRRKRAAADPPDRKPVQENESCVLCTSCIHPMYLCRSAAAGRQAPAARSGARRQERDPGALERSCVMHPARGVRTSRPWRPGARPSTAGAPACSGQGMGHVIGRTPGGLSLGQRRGGVEQHAPGRRVTSRPAQARRQASKSSPCIHMASPEEHAGSGALHACACQAAMRAARAPARRHAAQALSRQGAGGQQGGPRGGACGALGDWGNQWYQRRRSAW